MLSFCVQQFACAQCIVPITTFPYEESFENIYGDWFDGGYAPSWECGTPLKPVINAAGNGKNCWMTGGLKGSGYNNGENSWLQSPCFNFTSLKKPEISFMIFWETEKKYDGASFQYSVDDGKTWIIIGSKNSNNNCQGINWFNNSSINYLGGNPGWSGNVQSTSGSCLGGEGSNGWVIAKHDLADLAGMPSVVFRFTFGAGTACNNFDGFAFDNITIGEATPAVALFSYSCTSSNTVAFTNALSLCQTGATWDFGDPFSGSSNTASGNNPTHTFSSAGTYKVSYTANYKSAPSSTVINNITILEVTPSITETIKCSGDTGGAISIKVSGGNGPYNYSWSNGSSQNIASLSNLRAGLYTVTVNASDACSTTVTVILTEPEALKLNINSVSARCGKNNGAISTIVTGGVSPYQYNWSTGTNTPAIHDVNAGIYSINITDANGCTASATNIKVADIESITNLNFGNDTTICKGETIILLPGAFAKYSWQDNSIATTYIVRESGTYFVNVTDVEGCKGSDTINVTVGCREIYFPTGFTPNKDGRNEGFGPLGDVSSIKNYKMFIYGRWGQAVFSSTDPFKKWDSRLKNNSLDTQTFVWFATYELPGLKQQYRKGIITIVR